MEARSRPSTTPLLLVAALALAACGDDGDGGDGGPDFGSCGGEELALVGSCRVADGACVEVRGKVPEDGLRGECEGLLAGGGGRISIAVAVEQSNAELLLDCADPPEHGGMIDLEDARGARERARLPNVEDVEKIIPAQFRVVHCCKVHLQSWPIDCAA